MSERPRKQSKLSSFIASTPPDSAPPSSFPTLAISVIEAQKEAIASLVGQHLDALHFQLQKYFPSMESYRARYDWLRNPFTASHFSDCELKHDEVESLLEVASHPGLQQLILKCSLFQFCCAVKKEGHSKLCNAAFDVLLQFSSTSLLKKFNCLLFEKRSEKSTQCGITAKCGLFRIGTTNWQVVCQTHWTWNCVLNWGAIACYFNSCNLLQYVVILSIMYGLLLFYVTNVPKSFCE